MPKKTIEAIVVGGNEYVVQVKCNQKKLMQAIQATIENQVQDEYCFDSEKNRGRLERREIRLYKNVTGPIYAEWLGLNDVMTVRRYGIRKEEEYDEMHYYISSRSGLSAKEYLSVIRKHWYIENELHWVKDVIMYEDTSLVKNRDSASNQSIIRNLVFNVFKLNGHSSMKIAIEKFTNRITECLNILLSNKYELNRSE